MASAGSPGRSCCSPKIMSETKNSVGRSWTSLRERRASIVQVASFVASAFRSTVVMLRSREDGVLAASRSTIETGACFETRRFAALLSMTEVGAWSEPRSLHRQPDHADEPVRVGLETLEPGVVRDDHRPVVQVKD